MTYHTAMYYFRDKEVAMQNKLKLWRIKIGLTQEELAAEMGITRGTVIAIENNKNQPSARFVNKTLSVFRKRYPDVNYEDIFLGEVDGIANTAVGSNQQMA